MSTKPILADMLGFIDLPGKPPIVQGKRPVADILHLTAASPVGSDGPLGWGGTLANVLHFRQQLEEQGFVIVEKASDLDKSGTKVVLGLQNAPNGLLSNDEGWRFNKLYEAGIRIMQLWYKQKNEFGGGFGYPLHPVTSEGYHALYEMAQLGMILDLSHAGHKTARRCLSYAQGLDLNVMASHTGVYDVFPHIRNLPSDVLKGIAELGGVVGIYTLTFGLSVRNPTPSFAPHYEFGPFLEHLTAAVQCCGINAVGIGSDGTYRDIDAAVGEVHFQQLKQQLDPDGLFQARFPDHPLDLYSHQKLKKLVRAVSDIVWPWEANAGEKIMGNNFARFLREALPKE